MFTPSESETARADGSGAQKPPARRHILLVDDHALVRMSVISLCASVCKELEVLEASTLAGAMLLYEKHRESIELVLLDLNLPDSKGFAALQALKRQYPQSRIVVLSGAFDEAVAAEACVLGADKFLHKGAEPAVLAFTLSDLVEPLFGKTRRDNPGSTPTGRRSSQPTSTALSPREIEILNLVLQGKTNQEIVVETGLKLGTIKNYISGLFVVFGVPSRSKLVSLFV